MLFDLTRLAHAHLRELVTVLMCALQQPLASPQARIRDVESSSNLHTMIPNS
jgi:hypothetical protein